MAIDFLRKIWQPPAAFGGIYATLGGYQRSKPIKEGGNGFINSQNLEITATKKYVPLQTTQSLYCTNNTSLIVTLQGCLVIVSRRSARPGASTVKATGLGNNGRLLRVFAAGESSVKLTVALERLATGEWVDEGENGKGKSVLRLVFT